MCLPRFSYSPGSKNAQPNAKTATSMRIKAGKIRLQPCVEIEKAEGSSIELPEDDGRDQESGNHKEDINADIATRKDARFSMEPDHRQHRYSTKAVDFRTIVQGFRIMLTHKVSTMTWGHDFSNFGYPRQDRNGFAGYQCDIRKEYTLRDVSKLIEVGRGLIFLCPQ